jgi:hypothetical protein
MDVSRFMDQSNSMDDSVLVDEVLQLTLAYQQGDATPEERARLERLLLDNPLAVALYLRIVEDTLVLRASASARQSQPPTNSSECELLAAELASVAAQETDPEPSTLLSLIGRHWKMWAAPSLVLAASLLLAVFSMVSWERHAPANQTAKARETGRSARVMNVSNIVWAAGAKQFDEWSFVEPGDSLKFDRGLVNLFLENGAEVLIEGPADVDFVSIEKVFARKGKLAARVGPGAIGFTIETPHANVIDRGTAFGLSVDETSRTDVVVYEGMVDLDVLGDNAPPRRRLERGEALSVNHLGKLSRITTVQSSEFLEPPQVRAVGAEADRVITAVSDNAASLATAKYYRVVPKGFREDSRAFVDRLHEWNGVDHRGLPPFLLGGDYVMTFNDDKITTGIEIAVSVNQPATLYVLLDDRVAPPEWLKRDFVDTQWDVGSDDGWLEGPIVTGLGPGESVDHVFSVWRRDVLNPSTVVLGALSQEEQTVPAAKIGHSMYGFVATPLQRELPRPAVLPERADLDDEGVLVNQCVLSRTSSGTATTTEASPVTGLSESN